MVNYLDEDESDYWTEEDWAEYRKECYEDEQERLFEEKLERAHNCRCGAFSKKTGNQIADCICGAE